MTNNVLSSGAPFWRRVGVFLEAIKFEHSVFALPFAILAAFISAGGWPDLMDFVWVIVAMVSMRTFGMSANRLIDGEPRCGRSPPERSVAWQCTAICP